MLLIWIPVSVLVMYIILNIVYGKLWKKGLRAQLRFEERDVEEGDNATLVETMTNGKLLPLPVIKLSFKVDRSIVIDEDRNATVSDRTNVVEYFGLGGHEVVTRRQPVRACKRGYYLIGEAGISLPDFFSEGVRYLAAAQSASLLVCPRMLAEAQIVDISRQIIGEVVSRNRLYQDVFSFRGIREYAPGDPLSTVNWKASARTGEYMVNLRDYTSGQHVRFLLDLEPPSIRYSEELLEQGIRLAYTLAGHCIQARIPVSLASNGRDVITGKEVGTEAGSSARHLGVIGEALARINLSLKPRPFWELLREERLKPGGSTYADSHGGYSGADRPGGSTYADSIGGYTGTKEESSLCLISSGQTDALLEEAAVLSGQCGGLLWICILDPEVERKEIPAGIRFIPLRY